MSLIALVGLPNSGKSALFNTLTQSRQRVANFPGITVEKKVGELKKGEESFQVLDLPGIYSLDVSTLDEKVTKDYVFDKFSAEDRVDKIILVIDATNFKKSLYLALQLQEIGRDFVVAFNMSDLALKRGQKIDLDLLSQKLGGVKVIPTVAVDEKSVVELVDCVTTYEHSHKEINLPVDYQKQIKDPQYIKQKLSLVEEIVKAVTIKKIKADDLTEKVDSLVLHPVLGPIVLFVVLLFTFQLLFAWSDPFVGMIESFFEFLGKGVGQIFADGLLKSLLVDGIIAGVGGILVFLPHIVFLFIMIYFLEDIGYLGRAAFLLDYLMRKLGLPGKAVVPLLSSHACAIPGIMAARIIENPAQRLLTMMISPLATCSARLPVYTLLIAAIVPDQKLLGVLSYPGLVLFGLYIFGIGSAFIVAFFAKKTLVRNSPSYLLMELPPYRTPKFLNLLRAALMKGWLFIKKAGTVILVLSVIIWGLVTFPDAPENADKPAIHYSYAAKIGKTLQPVFAPLGFDWKLTTALIPSFGAREVLVAAMGTVYAVEGDDVEDVGFLKRLSHILTSNYSLATLMSLLIWFVFAPQCISTFAVLKKETGGYKMPLIFGFYTTVLAYVFAYLTYLIFI